MARVSLRIYNREIEGLIEQGQLDEAIAHCLHILKTYPKHLETYRLLGKAYLEGKRYAEAADIFGRVLSAVPDDFVSHVGLSIIHDDAGRPVEAAWHMERAFERQPSNAAVQAELQRLYARRDGQAPAKIRMTRGALAHMYVQGELYAQAIGEIRAVLAASREDPPRADMQVLLARAYFRNGQKVEASEVCSALLKRLPYCLDANRILTEILPGTGRAENTQVYRQRVQALDPYAAFVTGSIFESDSVPDAAVSLERLEWAPGQAPALGADWATRMGIALSAETSAPSLPEPPAARPAFTPPASGWADSLRAAAMPAAEEPVAEPEREEEEEEIPQFLRDAGWKSAPARSAEEEARAAAAAAEESAAALPAEDMPDWIRALRPSESAVAEPTPAAAEDLPDWLRNLGAETPAPSAPEPGPTPAPAAAEAGSLSDWLASLQEETGPAAPAPTPPPAAAPAPRPTPPPAAAPGSIGDLGTRPEDQDAALAWLESLAAKQGAKAEELITRPEERRESAPEWVEQARAVAGESAPAAPTPTAQPVEPEPAEELPAWLRDLKEEEPAGASGEDRTGLWMREQAAAIPAEEDVADWLKKLESEPEAAAPAVEEEEELPSWLGGQPETPPRPTEPSDWKPVAPPPPEVAPAAQPAVEAAPAPVPAPEPKPRPAPKPKPAAPRPAQGKAAGPAVPDSAVLAAAQEYLKRGDVASALGEYGKLVKRGRMLEEIIFDLREALYRFPVEVTLWEMLGDAYMRASRLQEALDAYTKAEELLR